MTTEHSSPASHAFSRQKVRRLSIINKLALVTTLIYIMLIPWGNAVFDGFTRLFGIAAVGTALLMLITQGTHRRYSFFHLLIVLFWSWIIISLIWSPDLETGKTATNTAIQLVIISFLISFVINSRMTIRLAYQAYVAGAFIASLIILYNFINGIESKYYGRYGITNFEVDDISIIIAFAIPMAAYLTTQFPSKLMKLFNAVAIPLCILAIFLTATRTGSIVAMVGVAYWLFIHRKANLKIKLLLLVFFISSVIGVFTFAPKASIDRVFSSSKSISSGTLNYRTVIWGASLAQWKKSPIIGNGIGSLYFVLNSSHVEYGNAHNTYIHVLTENGIIGLLLYLLVIFSILYYTFRAPLDEKAFLLALLMVVLLSQLTLNTLLYKETWFVLTILAIHAYLASIKTKNTHVI